MKFNPTILFRALTIMILVMLAASCNPNRKKAKVIAGDDTINSVTIHISVDESFAPIIDSQIKVFMSLNPKARIIAHYKPEADCLKDMLNDSTRMVVITRGLSDDEELYYKDTLSFVPMHGRIATDAIAVIPNNQAQASLFFVSPIRGMLNCPILYPV